MLPPDGHVHTQWSWDAEAGSMERSCERAVALGLPAIAFTEHVDFTPWEIAPATVAALAEPVRARVSGGQFRPPALDVAGYLECVRRCRERFPQLRIWSGLEVGEPHWHAGRVAALTGAGPFDRVLGSLHSLEVRGAFRIVDDLYPVLPAAEVVREYLAEVLRMVKNGTGFTALAHIDYPIRYWPQRAGRYDPGAFEAEYREVLAELAGTGRALEVNTTVPLPAEVVRWWYEAGGDAVCFGSDAHEPERVARGLREAAAMVETCGFRPGRTPYDFWCRSGAVS